MSPVRRPCIERMPDGRGCQRYAVENGSRCAEHEAERLRGRQPTPSQMVTRTARWKRLRASVLQKRRRADGTWACEICGRAIFNATAIDVDHIEPVSQGGAAWDESNLRVAHRKCNRRAGGLAQAEERRRRQAESLIGKALRAR